jgi:hypothetical protein
MKIEPTFPPNYEQINETLHIADYTAAVFTFRDTLHNPHDTQIRPDLLTHEEVHAKQQGGDPEGWWKRYLEDPQFRLEQEAEAYGVQYRFLKSMLDTKKTKLVLMHLASDLSGPGYGNMVDFYKAETLIRHSAK